MILDIGFTFTFPSSIKLFNSVFDFDKLRKISSSSLFAKGLVTINNPVVFVTIRQSFLLKLKRMKQPSAEYFCSDVFVKGSQICILVWRPIFIKDQSHSLKPN
jgi:hypothetical protein